MSAIATPRRRAGRRPLRHLATAGVAAVLALVGTTDALAEPSPPANMAVDFASCGGAPTQSDAAIASQLNGQLRAKLKGAMNAYRVSCARVITRTARARGLSERAAVIAITTAIVESGLQNYATAVDHDSLGLFQQRGSWGSAAQRTDPVWSTNAFLNKMIREYPNNSWQTAPIGEVCQRVQVSAFPARYQPEAGDAQIIVKAIGGLADVTGDGRPDLVGRTASGDLLMYPHSGSVNGESTWRSATKVGHGWNGMTALLLGDVTGDGWADLVGRTASGDLLMYPHSGTVNGEATWYNPTKVSHGWGGMTAILLGDVTGDGRPDLIGRTATGDLLMYPHSGTVNGESTWWNPTKVGHGWGGMTAILLGDVTGDGRADLVGRTGPGDLLMYPHSGSVNGESTFYNPTKVSHGWNGMTGVLL